MRVNRKRLLSSGLLGATITELWPASASQGRVRSGESLSSRLEHLANTDERRRGAGKFMIPEAGQRDNTHARHHLTLMRVLRVAATLMLVVASPATAQRSAWSGTSPSAVASGPSSLLSANSFAELQTAPSQPRQSSFAGLGRVLSVGDRVDVAERSGTETRGRVTALSATELTVSIEGARRVFSVGEVKQIDRRRRDSVRNGILLGAAAGAALGGAIGRGADSPSCPRAGSECGQGTLIGVVGGALWGGLGGWLTDALIQKRSTVYVAQPSVSKP